MVFSVPNLSRDNSASGRRLERIHRALYICMHNQTYEVTLIDHGTVVALADYPWFDQENVKSNNSAKVMNLGKVGTQYVLATTSGTWYIAQRIANTVFEVTSVHGDTPDYIFSVIPEADLKKIVHSHLLKWKEMQEKTLRRAENALAFLAGLTEELEPETRPLSLDELPELPRDISGANDTE